MLSHFNQRAKSPTYWSWLFATPLTSSHTISPFPATLQLQWYLCYLVLNMSNILSTHLSVFTHNALCLKCSSHGYSLGFILHLLQASNKYSLNKGLLWPIYITQYTYIQSFMLLTYCFNLFYNVFHSLSIIYLILLFIVKYNEILQMLIK